MVSLTSILDQGQFLPCNAMLVRY